jgi:predicted transcriptional regulator of viral defense system
MKSIDDHILEIMEDQKQGNIFILEDFKELGTAVAVRVALHRLVKRGIVKRLIPGLFVKPKTSKLLNSYVSPGPEKVAEAIARRDRARIIPTGSYALHVLGLSNQIPLKLVYLTDGKARKIKVGKSSIQFKKTSTKKLALRGKISKLVILAMGEIGKDKLSEFEKEQLFDLLRKEDIDDLKHDLLLAPQWIAEIINKGIKI